MAKRKKKKYNYNCIEFDSQLELDMYKILEDNDNIEIIDVHKSFILFKPLKYYKIETDKMASYSKMIYTPDIIIKIKGVRLPVAVEVKGYPRPEYKLRKKIFVNLYHDQYNFIELNTIIECEDFSARYN
ncbi:MAG: DUF1064 domain-containing protein [Flavobacteriaceae bacterium]|nr:DUF1064 domain-containing protein [Flavobacteriaceae bacterium]